jgi:hypothetical protein
LAWACRLNTRAFRGSAHDAHVNAAQHPDASAARLDIRQAQPPARNQTKQRIVFTRTNTFRRASPGKVGWGEHGVDAWAVKQFRSKAGTAQRSAETGKIWVRTDDVHQRWAAFRRDLRAAIEQKGSTTDGE